MTDNGDDSDKQGRHSTASEVGMRNTLVNLEEFVLMMSYRSSIRALEIIEVIPPSQEKPAAPRPQSQPAAVIIHPAARKTTE